MLVLESLQVMKYIIDIIAGARPNFMKIAPIIHELNRVRDNGSSLAYRLIHTGQHYDTAMSGRFFEQLGIPDPDVNLGVGSGTQAEQTGNIMIAYERQVAIQRPNLCLVVGDVNSTMACAITAKKLGIPVAHVEAGIRSGDWSMPEEVNRVVTDSIADWFFTTSESATLNLRQQGVQVEAIFFVGNTMIDTLVANQRRLVPAACVSELGLSARRYFVLTMHRPANVDSFDMLAKFLRTIDSSSAGLPVVFPVHPRTAKILRDCSLRFDNIQMVEPLGYLEFLHLVRESVGVITDSGGLSEETTVLGVPCLTLRNTTERPETVTIGTNRLIGSDHVALADSMGQIVQGKWKIGSVPPLWDGQCAHRIIAAIESIADTRR